MSALSSHGRFARFVAVGATALTVLIGAGSLAQPSAGAATASTDALQSRVRAELAVFTNWLAANGAKGYIGEAGWPNNGDTAQWNALARQWHSDAAAAGLWTTNWATGEWWGSNYKLSAYTWNTPTTMDGPLSVARSQAAVIEEQLSPDNRGVNMAGGEFGTPGPVDATSSFSNANRGAYNSAYHYDTQESFSYIASRGVSLVRLPFRWERIQPTLGGPLDAAELARLTEAVGRARVAGLRVILDVHNYGAYWLSNGSQGVRRAIGSPEVSVASFANLWSRLSSAFKADTGVVGYGLMNEPVGMSATATATEPQVWEQASQAALNAVRQNGDTRTVLVPGYNWSGAQQWSSQHPRAWISDPAANVRYEAHHYWDRTNSGAYDRTYAEEVADAQARGYSAPPTTAPPTTAPTTSTSTTVAPQPTTDTVAPSAPANLAATAGTRSAFLTWNASTDQGGSGMSGYEVWRAVGATGGSFVRVSTTPFLRYDNYRLTRDTTYRYFVRAYDGAGNRSAPSLVVTVTT